MDLQQTRSSPLLTIDENEAECSYHFSRPNKYKRLTGLICTIGQASHNIETIVQMLEEGMNIARLNFTYDSPEYHAESIEFIQKANEIYSKAHGFTNFVAIALATEGPQIRTGFLNRSGNILLKKDDVIRLTCWKEVMDVGPLVTVYIDFPGLLLLAPGTNMTIVDGNIKLLFVELSLDYAICQVIAGGWLGSFQKVIFPDIAVELPTVTEKDRSDLKFAVSHNLDMVIASRIRDASAITEIRNVLGRKGSTIKLIAEIESRRGLDNLDEIMKVSDGVVLSRTDLAREIPIEKMCLTQKKFIAYCNQKAKTVICASELLGSMRDNPKPTRAEVADLGNVVLDGADHVMFYGETAIGVNPVKVVHEASKICLEAERTLWYRNICDDLLRCNPPVIDAVHSIAIAAVNAARVCKAAAIVTFFATGHSIYLMTKYRPRCPIFSITRCPREARLWLFYRGVIPILYPGATLTDYVFNTKTHLHYVMLVGRKMGHIKLGDAVVVISPWREGSPMTNNLRIVYATFTPHRAIECLMFANRLKMPKLPKFRSLETKN